ncbi:hypothetical protein JVT61DRAFT_742 [Boletus reticuloceps]|uniref:Uncharacterized protein n=1 Tax=Boletus reticuloceps TaxID=495285 RepID=A0A8I2YZ62_9AGAM|nr:hypothetical protein JVT61DRAFT_742 [Boletus reticuloceps]
MHKRDDHPTDDKVTEKRHRANTMVQQPCTAVSPNDLTEPTEENTFVRSPDKTPAQAKLPPVMPTAMSREVQHRTPSSVAIQPEHANRLCKTNTIVHERSETVSRPEITKDAESLPEEPSATKHQECTLASAAIQPEHAAPLATGSQSHDHDKLHVTGSPDVSSQHQVIHLTDPVDTNDATCTRASNDTMANVVATRKVANDKDKRIPRIVVKKKDEVNGVRVTVQNIIQHPTSKLIDDNHVALYEPKLRIRLQQLSTYVNKEANVYALGKLLPTATWGAFLPLADHQNELCNPATNQPLVVWTVGHIATTWFTRNGEPEKQASITVVPLSQKLIEQYNLLIGGLSVPPSHTTGSIGAVRAVKWQSEKGSDTLTLFEEVYDARNVFTNKKDMPGYLVTDLKKNDLVLIEGRFTKYRTKDEENKWSLQRVQMELDAISLLHSNNYQHSQASNARDILGLHI